MSKANFKVTLIGALTVLTVSVCFAAIQSRLSVAPARTSHASRIAALTIWWTAALTGIAFAAVLIIYVLNSRFESSTDRKDKLLLAYLDQLSENDARDRVLYSHEFSGMLKIKPSIPLANLSDGPSALSDDAITCNLNTLPEICVPELGINISNRYASQNAINSHLECIGLIKFSSYKTWLVRDPLTHRVFEIDQQERHEPGKMPRDSFKSIWHFLLSELI